MEVSILPRCVEQLSQSQRKKMKKENRLDNQSCWQIILKPS
jgi:hypothetical protein